jgi:uncharacterized repeat protein (TIGR01451 family)
MSQWCQGLVMIRFIIFLSIIFAPPLALANDIALSSRIFVEKPISDNNSGSNVILEPLEQARSGDRLIYILEYRNVGAQTVSGFVVSNPLPRAVRFDQTIHGDEMVSVDNGRNWGRLEDLRIALANGRSRSATPADVTHLKWQMPKKLARGETGKVTFRAIVR